MTDKRGSEDKDKREDVLMLIKKKQKKTDMPSNKTSLASRLGKERGIRQVQGDEVGLEVKIGRDAADNDFQESTGVQNLSCNTPDVLDQKSTPVVGSTLDLD